MSNNIGAISALKGYRLQFLYSLYRILLNNENTFSQRPNTENGKNTFSPEGKYEDLDIYNSQGELIEIIQVKDYSSDLTLSKILSSKENTFLRRALKAYEEGHAPQILLISFGEVNDDIKELKKQKYSDKFIKKLKELRLRINEIEILEEKFDYIIVNEKALEEKIKEIILNSGLLIDIKITVDLLLYWLYIAAEKQQIIQTKSIIEQLLRIGKFESGRVDFHNTYKNLLIPLIKDNQTLNVAHLKADFYEGVSATYNHILAEVDAIRNEKLLSLKDKFKKTNIVFIHGASGQGKSTLAYRFLHNYCENHTVFELKIPTDISQISQLINALEGIVKGLGFPLTLYLDVTLGNEEWVNIVQSLSGKTNINFLITIREEAWNSSSFKDKFQFEELDLTFDKQEANIIYDALNIINQDLQFIDFDNAWQVFGEGGPLLEFVYLITQKESLPEKLKTQIRYIQENYSDKEAKDKLKLLRYVSLSDCYNAEINLKEIAKYLQLDEIQHIVSLLQKEYLVKIADNGTSLIGLHPIRSKIIKKILFDEEIHCENEYAIEAIHFIKDNTILNFYRNAFRYSNLLPIAFLDKLKTFNPASWIFYDQIFQCLLWKGIEDYVIENNETLSEVYQVFNKGWWIFIEFDFSGMNDKPFYESIDHFTNEQHQNAKKLNRKLTDNKSIFQYTNEWLNSLTTINITPNSIENWNSFCLFMFWIHYFNLNIELTNIDATLKKDYIGLPIDTLSKLLYYLKAYHKSTHLQEVEAIFLEKLCKKFNIVIFEKDTNEIICEYFFDFIDNKETEEKKDFIHTTTMQIVDLIRYAYPEKEKYNVQGFGHKFSFIPDDFQQSAKKEIPKRNLPLKELVNINSTFHNIVQYKNRPNSWNSYVENVLENRQNIIDVIKQTAIVFKNYHKRKNYQILIDYYNNYIKYQHYTPIYTAEPLPKNIIDQWGDFSENSPQTMADTKKENSKVLSTEKYKSFTKLYSKYTTSTSNFLRQSAETILRKIKGLQGDDITGIQDNSRISLYNLFEAYKNLLDFDTSFRTHFQKFVGDINQLKKLEAQEIESFSALCSLYCHYIYPTTPLPNTAINIASNHLINTKKTVDKKIHIALKKISNDSYIEYLPTEKKCLIFAIFENPLDILVRLKDIYNAIFEAVDLSNELTIKSLIIESYYPAFYIIPIIKGKTFNNKWYEFKSYHFRDASFEQLNQMNFIPQDIPDNIIKQFNFQAWNQYLPEFKDLEKMVGSIFIAYQYLFHAFQFYEIKNDNYNKAILNPYIQKLQIAIKDNLQTGFDLFSRYLYLFENNDNFNTIKDKLFLLKLYQDSYMNFFPNDESANEGKFDNTLHKVEMEIYLKRLEVLINNIGLIYYFLSGKFIDNCLKG